MERLLLRPCDKHITGENLAVQMGRDMTTAERNKVADTLLCKACWTRNPEGMKRLCAALKVAGRQLDVLLAHRR